MLFVLRISFFQVLRPILVPMTLDKPENLTSVVHNFTCIGSAGALGVFLSEFTGNQLMTNKREALIAGKTTGNTNHLEFTIK
jgi:hypothetical protein